MGEPYSRERIDDMMRRIKSMNERDQAIQSSYIRHHIHTKLIDPTLYLGQVILNLSEGRDLYHLGLACRFGADVNQHLEISPLAPGAHPLVILGLTFVQGKMSYEVFLEAYNILHYFGSNSLYPAYSYTEGDLDMHYMAEVEMTPELGVGYNVEMWMEENGLRPEIYDIQSLPEPQKSYLAGVLDDPRYFDSTEMTEEEYLQMELPDVVFLLKCLSYRILSVSEIDIHHYVSFENHGIRESILCMNPEAYDILSRRGFETTYFSVNRACYLYHTSPDDVAKKMYRHIISEMIRTGHKLTLDHFSLLNREQYFKDLYEVEKWKKLSSRPEHNLVELRKIAFELGLDYSTSSGHIIKSLKYLDGKSEDEVLKMMKERQCKRLKESISFIGDTKVDCECPKDAYADARIVFYKDEDGRVFSFDSELYASLLRTGLNPTTRKPLPLYLLQQIQSNLDVLKKFGANLSVDTKCEVKKFKMLDKMDDREDKFILKTIESAAKYRGIPTVNYPTGVMMIILGNFGIDNDYFPNISDEHRLHSFVRALYEYTKMNAERMEYVYQYLQQNMMLLTSGI